MLDRTVSTDMLFYRFVEIKMFHYCILLGVVVDRDLCALFPFLSQARRMLREKALSPELLALGQKRALALLKGWDSGFSTEEHVLSYAGERALLALAGNKLLLERLAVLESKRIYAALNEVSDEVFELVERELGIKVERREGKWWMDLASFVSFAPESPHYHLVAREVKQGWVRIRHRDGLAEQERARILAEAAKIRFLHLPRIDAPPELQAKAKELVEPLLASLPKVSLAKISQKAKGFPPCIERILNQLRQHENLSHHARWVLAVFLFHRGYGEEEIVRLFSAVPDFKEQVTRYQVRHIMRRRYMMPSCDSLRSLALCVAECGIKNPLQWRERDGRRGAEKGE